MISKNNKYPIKLCFALYSKYAPHSSWQITYSALKNACKKHVIEIQELYCGLAPWQEKLLKIYGKFNYSGGGTGRLPFFSKIIENRIIDKLKKIPQPDLIVHIADFNVPLRISSKIINACYIDAILYGYLREAEYQDIRHIPISFYKNHLNISKKYFERMKAIFTFNEWTKSTIINDYQIAREKVFNIGFGSHLEAYNEPKTYDKHILLIVLRKHTERWKGLPLLLQAFPIVKKIIPDIKLILVGTKIDDKLDGIICYENYPRNTTVDLFREATLYTMPAIFEPNGIAYIEALFSKTPIVGLNKFAFPEFSGYGKYGFIINDCDPTILAQTIIEAFKNKELLYKMALEGQEFAMNRYNWNNVAKAMIETLIG